MKKLTLLGALAALLLVIPLAASAQGSGGVTGPAFYVDGELYRTVLTPTDLSDTGAPDSSFDTLYNFQGAQMFNVSEAGPGDLDYNGGRWIVELVHGDYSAALAIHDANSSGDFDSAEEVEAALAAGDLYAVDGPRFECPVIPLPGHGR